MTIKCDYMERIKNLGEKIYWSVFLDPKYKLEISNEIYGRECKAIYPEIKKLEKRKWIKKVPMPENVNIDIAGKRANRRQYYSANIQPLLDDIIENLERADIEIDRNEKEKLKSFLNSSTFKTLLCLYKKINSFYIAKELLIYACVFLSYRYKYLSSMKKYKGKNFDNLMTKHYINKNRLYIGIYNHLGINLIEKLSKLNSYTSIILLEYLDDLASFFESLNKK